MSKGTFKIDEACRHWVAEVSGVASLYERRWTRMALNRVDAELAARLAAQQSLFDSSCLRGTVADIEQHGAAMCRGWLAAIRAMNHANDGEEGDSSEPDDSYLLGSDPVSGLKVAIGVQKAAAERVVELYGQDVIWISPDEVAAMIGGVEKIGGAWVQALKEIKQAWPGAEILRYGNEGS